MMTATGKKLEALEISQNGAPITVLGQHKGVFAFTLNGQSYTIRTSGLFGRSYELRRGDEMLASAKGETFRDRTTVTFGDKVWLLKAENISTTRFGLYDGATRLGGIASGNGSPRWNGATIDVPDALPLDVQLLLTSIVLAKWGEPNTY
jgi:hypothetical protein